MATITVRALSEQTRSGLRLRAARSGRSMEAEVRAILDAAVADEGESGVGLGTQFAALFAGVDTAGFETAARSDELRAADLT